MTGTVVVITGASSGIGRATAHAFAARRAKLVLFARKTSALEEAAAECRARGAEACVCTGDTSVLGDIDRLQRTAVEAFGRIDVWVNCAAVLSFGRFEDIPPEAFARTVETNIIGYANGARAALRQFASQGDRGALVNVCSLLGMIGEPYVSAYVTTKFAIRGLAACLREEVRGRPGLSVSTVMPAAVDTPMYQKAMNLLGRRARSIVPVYAPERVAEAIVRAAERGRGEVVVTGFGHLISLAERIAPSLLDMLLARFAPRVQFEDVPQQAADGNLYQPAGPHAVTGGWREYWAVKLGWRKAQGGSKARSR